VAEFGVATGNGLLALEEYAAAVERETGVKIQVYGFDTGKGLPSVAGDFRDHPDQWITGDYQMDEAWLRKRLSPRTALVLGDIEQTVTQFVRDVQTTPVGFVSVDVDLYSSAKSALQIFLHPKKQMLRRVPMYFDDVNFVFNHEFAGERLAIKEFNQSDCGVKIDRWHGIANGRVFFENPWLRNMYLAHDLEAISRVKPQRTPATV